jgi:hypothetical protein
MMIARETKTQLRDRIRDLEERRARAEEQRDTALRALADAQARPVLAPTPVIVPQPYPVPQLYFVPPSARPWWRGDPVWVAPLTIICGDTSVAPLTVGECVAPLTSGEQGSLDGEAQRVLYENLWSLYAVTDGAS